MKNSKITPRNITLVLLALTSAVTIVFVCFPILDLKISSLFADETGHFPAQDNHVFAFVREFLLKMMWLFVLLTLLVLGFSALLGQGRHVALRLWAYPVLVSLTGPLILVNAVFKNNWGRARPYVVEEFGGDRIFTRAYEISDQCATNCSFTSGEGAGIATVAIVTGVMIWHNVTNKFALVLALSALVFVGAGLRIIKGMHFFSDSALSVLFCALIAVFFYWLLNIGAYRQRFTWTNIKADIKLLGRRAGSLFGAK